MGSGGLSQLQLGVATGGGLLGQLGQGAGGVLNVLQALGRGQVQAHHRGHLGDQATHHRGVSLYAQGLQSGRQELGGADLGVTHHVPGASQRDGTRQRSGKGGDVLERKVRRSLI